MRSATGKSFANPPRGRDSPHAGRLAGWLGYDSARLRHAVVPKRKPSKRRLCYTLSQTPGATLAGISEMARRYLPEAILRYEGGAASESLRILRARRFHEARGP